MAKNRVYSGIRATGRLHLGNYLGAVKGMLALQDKYDCIFSVVDLHAITTPYDPKALQQNIREVVLDFLAAGLDPSASSGFTPRVHPEGQVPKCLIEIQSKVPQHVELAYLLSTIYPVSRLEDLPTYKEKKAQYPKYINMGLLYYPVLMAADVLLYKGELVPVGIDQEPHLEVMREIARKFNSMFSGTFPEPQRFATSGEYVPSLTGEGKMSKTVEGSYITLTDDLETIKAKLAKVPTDAGSGSIKNGEYIAHKSVGGGVHATAPSGGVEVLMIFVELFEGKSKRQELERRYQGEGIRYSEVKEQLSEAIYKELQPLQERRKNFEENPKMVDEILEESNRKCRELAEETMREVRQKMGL